MSGTRIAIKLEEGGMMPTKATPGSAGWDLYAAENVELVAGQTKAVSLGFRVEVPVGWEMQIRSRSGLALKNVVVANAPGTVDSDYRGVVKVLLHYTGEDVYDTAGDHWSPSTFLIEKGDRIAQAVIAPVFDSFWQPVEELSDTNRGSGGFGSTGK